MAAGDLVVRTTAKLAVIPVPLILSTLCVPNLSERLRKYPLGRSLLPGRLLFLSTGNLGATLFGQSPNRLIPLICLLLYVINFGDDPVPLNQTSV